ncbi:conserved hypothetical protein [Nostocoides japonicum T1-X7]|uniref:Glyoxalase-like domain-containing protein n=1 Tax=Nostocoides japonicum T1-X7 TaxID=1194083 RepID=A0A077LTG5_9MICO|nr:VOC family protein [Tetrasphaera japonica]CCH76798.1 conserved hypothetical protein [Tetrasphaera japonica T1-X7]
MSLDIDWMWLFIDTPEARAEQSWAFWGAATRSEIADLRGDREEFATLSPRDGDPWVKLQTVGGSGGVHVDLDVEDPSAAATVAVELGADVVRREADESGGFVVMASPGGFVFCLTRAGHPRRQHRMGEPDLLDQLCLDIPSAGFDAESAFWSGLTGWPVRSEHAEAEFRSLARPEGMPVRVLLQRLGEDTGPVRAHLDLASGDRATTVERHVGLGASVLREHQYWTVLRDPVGMEYCVTERAVASGELQPFPR